MTSVDFSLPSTDINPPIPFVVRTRTSQDLHLRPAAQLAELACRFAAETRIRHEGKTADARSILEILLLAVPGGSTVILESSGPEASEAIEAMKMVIASG